MKKDEAESNIYLKLREVRRSRGLTVNKLAEKMGENHQKVGRVERGQGALTIDYLLKISEALNTPVSSFIQGETAKQNDPIPPKQNSSILSDLVLLVEQHFKTLAPEDRGELKAAFISSVYSQALKLPADQQKLFLDTLFASLMLLNRK